MDHSSNSQHEISGLTQYQLNARLIEAATKGRASTVESLITQGANLSAVGHIALIEALKLRYISTIKVLLVKLDDATLDKGDNIDNSTALIWAARNGDIEVVNLLLPRLIAANILNSRDQHGRTALMWAARNGHTACV